MSYPLSPLESIRRALTGYRRCELCNARNDHPTYECWLLRKHAYWGLITGALHENHELAALEKASVMGTQEQLDTWLEARGPLFAWATQAATDYVKEHNR